MLRALGFCSRQISASLGGMIGRASLRGGIVRGFSEVNFNSLDLVRNIGISAHIDSGKTTLTERILFYTGRINAMHEVRGNDGVGAVMDSMELEREKGITIQSAATHVSWDKHHINIIDTPGHVDFTIEVERALRVLDGAIMVLCGVGGVQSQTITVDRQMRRYTVPRLAFINKLDRMGANPHKVLQSIRSKLRLHCAMVQLPIGSEADFKGVVDLVNKQAYYFEGHQGTERVTGPIPPEMLETVEEKYKELLEAVSNSDDELAEIFLADEKPTTEQLKKAIRRATISNKFIPVFMGSAYKNKGIQNLLDGVIDYLPNPKEVSNVALDLENKEAKVNLSCSDSKQPFVGLAFKLDQSKFGQLTYMRIYQGQLAKGGYIVDQKTGKKVKVPRLVRMHSNSMEDVSSVSAGDIVAMFGVDCVSGTTFTDGTIKYSMTSMFVPEPVMSLAVKPKSRTDDANFSKALQRFQKEDPTFRVHFDMESKETIMSGMGELHLEVYVERMKREYKVECVTGAPRVNYRECITQKATFDFLHKKQSGGNGQYGAVKGYIEPLPLDSPVKLEFNNNIIGTIIPNEYIPAIEKGFLEACEKSHLTGHAIDNVRFVLEDGKAHMVDSNEISFRLAAMGGFRQAFDKAAPQVLEPIMAVEVDIPQEYQSSIIGLLAKRKGAIREALLKDGDQMTVFADVPLSQMFGFSTELRSSSTGKGEYTMEFTRMEPVDRGRFIELQNEFQKQRQDEMKKK